MWHCIAARHLNRILCGVFFPRLQISLPVLFSFFWFVLFCIRAHLDFTHHERKTRPHNTSGARRPVWLCHSREYRWLNDLVGAYIWTLYRLSHHVMQRVRERGMDSFASTNKRLICVQPSCAACFIRNVPCWMCKGYRSL
jgi:hypothetical protein